MGSIAPFGDSRALGENAKVEFAKRTKVEFAKRRWERGALIGGRGRE
jgi:hypothetical protein